MVRRQYPRRNVWKQFGTETVVIIHDHGTEREQRHDVEAHVQGQLAVFAVDAPVFEGDRLEMTDPRGGMRVMWVTQVEIFKTPRSPSMNHIEARLGSHPPEQDHLAGATQVVHGDAIIVSGSHVNIATRSGSIKQGVPVTAGYEDIARAVKGVMELLETEPDLDTDDLEAAHEAGAIVLEEIVKSEPDRSRIKRALATLRGVLTAATSAAAAAGASTLIHQLTLPH